MTRIERKKMFIRAIAEYLAGNQGGKSIALEMEGATTIVKWAKEWQELRSLSPLGGYPTVDEAEEELWEFMG